MQYQYLGVGAIVSSSPIINLSLFSSNPSPPHQPHRSMTTYKITDAVEHQYHGSGWALAAITNNEVVALRYLSDIATDEVNRSIQESEIHAPLFVKTWLDTNEASNVVRELQAIGEVSIGICSCWEFTEM